MKLANPALICFSIAIVLLGCTDEYQVEQCSPGQGLNLETQGVPFFGEETGPIDVTLFVDFQCPYSEPMAFYLLGYMHQLELEGLGGYLRLNIRHFPSSTHNRARAAALAAAAAHRQGDDAFRRLFSHLFKNGGDLSDEKILLYAELAELDLDLFAIDLESELVAEVVDQDFGLGAEIGLTSTPGVIVCGIKVNGEAGEVIDNLQYLVEGEV